MKKTCINCAYASEFYPSFMNVCDRDGHVIYDADEDSCEGFETMELSKSAKYTAKKPHKCFLYDEQIREGGEDV